MWECERRERVEKTYVSALRLTSSRNTFRMFKLAVGSAVIGAATAKTYFKEDFSTDRA